MAPQPTAQQIEMAEKITEIARKPVTDLMDAMRFMKWPADLQAIVLGTLADEAQRASRRVRGNTDGR